MNPERELLGKFAEEIAEGVARKTISQLQKIPNTLSPEDSGLKNAWDEICVQIQSEYSFFWDAYDETARSFVATLVEELRLHQKMALWLRTDAGWDWLFEDEEDRSAGPSIFESDIVEYILSEYVYSKAGRWSNKRVREYVYGKDSDD
jgi:hypothetical protein